MAPSSTKSGRSSLSSRIKSFPICSILVVLAILLSICLSSSATETNSPSHGLIIPVSGKTDRSKSHQEALNVARRSLEIGSMPPNCEGRCRGCTPCRAQVPHGARHLQAIGYHPSVWRCTCGGKVYRPGPPGAATQSLLDVLEEN